MAQSSPEERFKAAVKVIQSLPKNGSFQPSHAMMLTFYGLYKQATNGICNISQPYMWDVVGRAKWDAWNKLGNMTQEQAMIAYVDELKQIIETMPHTENVQDFIETLGTFYELIDDESVPVSSPIASVIRKRFSPKRASPINAKSSPSLLTLPPDHSDDSIVATVNGHQSPPTTSTTHHNSTTVLHNDEADVSSDSATTEEVSCVGRVKPIENDAISSDGEEFCDTSDITSFNGEPSRLSVSARTTVISVCEADTISALPAVISRPEDKTFDGTLNQGKVDDVDRLCHPKQALGTSVGLVVPSDLASNLGTVEQINVALVRLQQDMNSVLTRLQTLERLSIAQNQIIAARNLPNSTSLPNRTPWFPFVGLNMSTVAFIVVWPFLVNFLLKQLGGRRRH